MKHIIIASIAAGCLMAQGPDYKTLSGTARTIQNAVKNNVIKSADKMPAEFYSFQPTDAVRTFGQLVGHIADANNNFCSGAAGEANPAPGIEKSKTTKADLTAALKAAFDYCDKVYSGLTDAQAVEIIKFRNQERNKLSLLTFNSFHSNLHYGNIVTYMRLKNLVPASSER